MGFKNTVAFYEENRDVKLWPANFLKNGDKAIGIKV
jgi:hypothetical protein